MKIITTIIMLCMLFVVATPAKNKYSSDQTDCEKDSTQQHCLKKDHDIKEESDNNDEEPEFYEDDDDTEEAPAEKWKGRQSLFQWDPVEVGWLLY